MRIELGSGFWLTYYYRKGWYTMLYVQLRQEYYQYGTQLAYKYYEANGGTQ